MACKTSPVLFARVVLISILLAVAEQAAAKRGIPTNQASEEQTKHPEWFIEHDGSVLIPGIGRVMLPPVFQPHTPNNPFAGSTGGNGYVPGGDDTFVPNPGFEVPLPGNGKGASVGKHAYP